jgi:hypothetical protein
VAGFNVTLPDGKELCERTHGYITMKIATESAFDNYGPMNILPWRRP